MDRHLPLDNACLRVVGFRDQVAHLAYQLKLSYFLPTLCVHRRIISDIGLGFQYLVGSDWPFRLKYVVIQGQEVLAITCFPWSNRSHPSKPSKILQSVLHQYSLSSCV